MGINRERVRRLLHQFAFQQLFVEEMGWSYPASEKVSGFSVNGQNFNRKAIAQLSGVWVYQVSPLPDTKTRAKIYADTEQLAHENLLIFLDHFEEPTQSLWYWVKRDGKRKLAREHLYLKGQPGDLFLSKLDGFIMYPRN